MMTYNEARILSNHLRGVLDIAGQAVVSTRPSTKGQDDCLKLAMEYWLKVYPDSPVKDALKCVS